MLRVMKQDKTEQKATNKSLVYICTKCGIGMLNNEETKQRHIKFCKGK